MKTAFQSDTKIPSQDPSLRGDANSPATKVRSYENVDQSADDSDMADSDKRAVPENQPDQSGTAVEDEQPTSPSKKGFLKYILIVAAVIAVPLGIYYYLQSRNYESTDDAFIEGLVVQVSPRVEGHVQQVFVNDNQVVQAGALLFELDPRPYQAKVDAAEAQLKVAQANQRQASIAIDVTSVTATAAQQEGASAYQSALAEISSSEAVMHTAERKVAEAVAMVDTARANLKQAQSAVDASAADADRLTSDAQRTKSLYESKNVAREDYEHALALASSAHAKMESARDSVLAMRATVLQAEASLNATSSTVNQFRAQVAVAQSDALQAKAKMESSDITREKMLSATADYDTATANIGVAQANLETAKLNLSFTKVTAATAGKVTRKNVEKGTYLAPGQTVMALVENDLWVVANFKENQLEDMNPGDMAEIEVDMYGGRKIAAHVESIQAGTGSRFSLLPPENATGNYVKVVQRVPVKLVFDEQTSDTENLAPGLSVKPKVRVQ